MSYQPCKRNKGERGVEKEKEEEKAEEKKEIRESSIRFKGVCFKHDALTPHFIGQ